MWQLSVGICKRNKYASRDSGDTAEIVERPGGGVSVVIADAQGSGSAAKVLSNLVTAQAVALIKDGVRDLAVHEAVHDHLYYYKGGRVSCTLVTVSADLRKRLCTITRNSADPAYFLQDGRVTTASEESAPLGIVDGLRPVCIELPLCHGTFAVATSDGVASAGSRTGQTLNLCRLLSGRADQRLLPEALARDILDAALELDAGRPVDDMTVAVMGVLPRSPADEARTMCLNMPLRADMLAGEPPPDM